MASLKTAPPPPLQLLLAVLLVSLVSAAPASPADRANIGLRKQVAAPDGVLRATDAPEGDVSQALICSQIFGVLPFTTFRRQRFDSFTTCRCVSAMAAVCEPDTFYPTVAPGTPEAAHAQELSGFGSAAFLQVLNAFSVQQTCFFEHLRGQKLTPPRPCAFSWQRAHRPSCDCAQPGETLTEVVGSVPEKGDSGSGLAAAQTEPTPTAEAVPEVEKIDSEATEPTQGAPGATAGTTAAPPTKGTTKAPPEDAATREESAAAGVERSAALGAKGGQRQAVVAEAFHLRRVRAARGQ